MRKLFLLSFVSLLLPACGTKEVDACAGLGGTCLNVKVVGGDGVTSVDALDIRLVGGSIDNTKRSTPSSALSLPLTVAVLIDQLPADPLKFNLTVTGYVAGRAVGNGAATGSIGAGQHQTVLVTLSSQTVDHDMAIPDLAARDDAGVPDLAQDLAPGADLAQPSDDGGCTFLPVSPIVADFESSGKTQNVVNGNFFYVTVDVAETGTTSPAKQTPVGHTALTPARGTSNYGMHVTANALVGYGVTIAANLSFSNNPVDLSHYSGFQFYAKGTSPTITTGIDTTGTEPALQCNSCAKCDVCVDNGGCYAAFVKSSSLSTNWTLFTVKWTDLAQQSWGNPKVSFDPSQAVQLVFNLPNGTWDLWLDDITLIP